MKDVSAMTNEELQSEMAKYDVQPDAVKEASKLSDAELNRQIASLQRQEKGANVFNALDKTAPKATVEDAKSIFPSLLAGTARLAIGAGELVPKGVIGATRLASPDAADYLQGVLDKNHNTIDQGIDQLTGTQMPSAGKTLLNNAGTLAPTLLIGGGPGFSGAVAGGALPGAIAGLINTKAGDTRGDTLTKIAEGAALGGAAGGALYGAGKVGSAVYNKAGELINGTGPSLGAQATAAKARSAIKQEIDNTYKQLGVTPGKFDQQEIAANTQFFNEFKHTYSRQVTEAYNEAFKNPPTPLVNQYFNSMSPDLYNSAREELMKSKDIWAINAKQVPGTMQYFEAMKKQIGLMGSGGNSGLVKDMTRLFSEEIPGYAEAVAMSKNKALFKKDISSDFFKAIQTDATGTLSTRAQAVMTNDKGIEAVDKLIHDGFSKQLIANSNKPALEQLASALGSNPLQQQNSLAFIRSVGKEDVANKLEAFANMDNIVKQATKDKSDVIGRMLGQKAAELDPTKMADAFGTIANNKLFSDQFNKIMLEQQSTINRTEKLMGLIRRASGYTSGNAAAAVVSGQTKPDYETTGR